MTIFCRCTLLRQILCGRIISISKKEYYNGNTQYRQLTDNGDYDCIPLLRVQGRRDRGFFTNSKAAGGEVGYSNLLLRLDRRGRYEHRRMDSFIDIIHHDVRDERALPAPSELVLASVRAITGRRHGSKLGQMGGLFGGTDLFVFVSFPVSDLYGSDHSL
jgi:hypothetical protein